MKQENIKDIYEIDENGIAIPKKQKLKIIVPIEFIRNSDLNIYEKALYQYIWTYGVTSRTAFPSYTTIAKDLGFGITTIKKTIKSLEDKNGLFVLNRFLDDDKKKKTTNLYYLGEIVEETGGFNEKYFDILKQLCPTKEIVIKSKN